MSTQGTKTLQVPEPQLRSEGRRCHPQVLCDTSGTYLDRRHRHTTYSACEKQASMRTACSLLTSTAHKTRHQSHNPQLPFLLHLDPKLNMKKYCKLFCLGYCQGNNAPTFTPQQAHEKTTKPVWFLFACGQCLSTLMAKEGGHVPQKAL